MKPLLALALAFAAPPASAASLAGQYDGSQMEMAVALELGEDGHFRFFLAYGALDEQGEGRWTERDGQVLLTSDPPVTPPRFLLLGQSQASPNELRFTIELPAGMDEAYFSGAALLKSGEVVQAQVQDGVSSLEFDPNDPPVEAVVQLGVLGLVSDPVRIDPAKGYRLAYRFEPNDIGKVAFESQPLRKDGADLLLERHGRLIRFRRSP